MKKKEKSADNIKNTEENLKIILYILNAGMKCLQQNNFLILEE